MDLVGLRATVVEVNFNTHGVPAQVTRPAPDDTVIATRVIWLTPGVDQLPSGAGFGRVGPTHLMAIRLDEGGTVPLGTLVMAAPQGGAVAVGWKVDGIEGLDGLRLIAHVV